jgi:phosphatidylglycerol:prolipoprotein diacylglycerol transferase
MCRRPKAASSRNYEAASRALQAMPVRALGALTGARLAVKAPPALTPKTSRSAMQLFVLPYPVIDPVAIAFGPLAIRWYGLAYMAGILLGWLYGRYLVSRPELWGGKPAMTVPQADDFLLWITLGIVVGGRLGFVLFYEPSFFWHNPAEIPAVWHGGMSFHGGLLGVVLAVYLFATIKGINPLSLGDVASAATPFGLFFGRIANFINAEVVGRVSDVPWAMVFPGAGDSPRHPSQLYEAFLEGIVLFIILRIATHRYHALTRPGTVFGLFLVFYGLFRSLTEFVREPHAGHPLDIGILTPGIAYSIPMVLIGLWLIWRARRKAALAAT